MAPVAREWIEVLALLGNMPNLNCYHCSTKPVEQDSRAKKVSEVDLLLNFQMLFDREVLTLALQFADQLAFPYFSC